MRAFQLTERSEAQRSVSGWQSVHPQRLKGGSKGSRHQITPRLSPSAGSRVWSVKLTDLNVCVPCHAMPCRATPGNYFSCAQRVNRKSHTGSLECECSQPSCVEDRCSWVAHARRPMSSTHLNICLFGMTKHLKTFSLALSSSTEFWMFWTQQLRKHQLGISKPERIKLKLNPVGLREQMLGVSL